MVSFYSTKGNELLGESLPFTVEKCIYLQSDFVKMDETGMSFYIEKSVLRVV